MKGQTLSVAVALLGAAVLATVAVAGEESKALSKSQLVGVWRMCYEPDWAGGSDSDSGFLIFLPDDRYIRMVDTTTVGGSPRVVETGVYEVEPQGVVLHGAIRQAPDGTVAGGPYFKPWPLKYQADRPVVFGKADKGSPKKSAVLFAGRDVNYGFAKIF